MDDIVFVPLTQHKAAIIDGVDAPEILSHKWHVNISAYNMYACRKVGKRGQQKRIWMHRLIAGTPDGQECHHKDGNSLNNRRGNLENCTRQRNLSYRKRG